MIIALDGSDLAAERVDGPGVYAGELLPRLTRVLTGRGHAVRTYAPESVRDVSVAGEVRVIPGSPFWTQRFFAAALRREKPDVVFLPIQTLPLFRPRGMTSVAVVHDLEFLRYPETYGRKNRMLLRWLTLHAVRHATRLIAVSHYTKGDIVRTYGRPEKDITVVHHGVDAAFFEQGRTATQSPDIPERYVLFVGAMQPRKNIIRLIEAFEQLEDSTLHLVMVSGSGWKASELRARIERSPVRARIHVRERLGREAVRNAYQHALAFVLPSLSEGFGMPVLEAMAVGVPVVTSNTSSLPEIAGDAAVFVDPCDVPGIAQAIRRVLTEKELRARLSEHGRARARTFTWERSAIQTAEVIEAAGRAGTD